MVGSNMVWKRENRMKMILERFFLTEIKGDRLTLKLIQPFQDIYAGFYDNLLYSPGKGNEYCYR